MSADKINGGAHAKKIENNHFSNLMIFKRVAKRADQIIIKALN